MGKRKQFDDILEGKTNPRPATVRKLLDNTTVMATPRLGGKRYGPYDEQYHKFYPPFDDEISVCGFACTDGANQCYCTIFHHAFLSASYDTCRAMVDWLKEKEGPEDAFKELGRIHCDYNAICADLAWQGFLLGRNTRAKKKAKTETREQVRALENKRISLLYNIKKLEDKFAKEAWDKTLLCLPAGYVEGFELHCLAGMFGVHPLPVFVALKLFPAQVWTKDGDGNLPLHIAASNPLWHANTHGYGSYYDSFQNDRLQEMNRPVIKQLLNVYPEAASIGDRDGRLPLHLFIENHGYWDDDIDTFPYGRNASVDELREMALYDNNLDALIEAYPDAVETKDPLTELYPFALAAATDAPLEVIFTLLEANPSVLMIISTEQG